MQFTSKFILLAIALVYGSAAASALPIDESSESVAARSAEYEDINAREIDDMELFVRGDPLLGYETPPRDRANTPPPPVSPFQTFFYHFFYQNCLIISVAIEGNVCKWKTLRSLAAQANHGRSFSQKFPEVS
jgi:hypothetical protein